MSQTIVNGGSRTSADLYTGPLNEVTADDSNMELRLHDGATPGGYRIPNVDTNDSRYQSKNAELDGFNFDPSSKGFLTRIAAGVYRLRKFLTDGNITIQYPDASTGNPTFGLATTLEGDRRFSGGDVIIDQVLQVTGGVNANVAGNLTGDSTGTHTGSTIGSVDARGKTIQVDDGALPESAIAGLAASLAAALVPTGCILLWSGTVETIPAHWVLCDGTNGTPNLSGQFVLGAGDDAHVGQQGGTASHTHAATTELAGIHNHSVVVAGTALTIDMIPSHTHNNGVCDNNNPSNLFNHGQVPANPTSGTGMADVSDQPGIREGITTATGGGLTHTHDASLGNSPAHLHVVDVPAVSHMPPYYSLAYIMKTN